MAAVNRHLTPQDKETLLRHFDEKAAAARAVIADGVNYAFERRLAFQELKIVLKAAAEYSTAPEA
jgi:uncharacterized protein (UPF0216 family)